MTSTVWARWSESGKNDIFAFYLVNKTTYIKGKFNVNFKDGGTRKDVPVNEIRVVETDNYEPQDDFEDLPFRKLTKEPLNKAVEILGGIDEVTKNRWPLVRALLGIPVSTSLSNRLKLKYKEFNKQMKITASRKRKPVTLSKKNKIGVIKRKKRKFPPHPVTHKCSGITTANLFHDSIFH